MKRILLLLAFAISAFADETLITDSRGRVYAKARVVSVTKTGVTFYTNADGVRPITLSFAELSESDRKRFEKLIPKPSNVIRTLDGRVYENVWLEAVKPRSVVIYTEETGSVEISVEKLRPEDREKLKDRMKAAEEEEAKTFGKVMTVTTKTQTITEVTGFLLEQSGLVAAFHKKNGDVVRVAMADLSESWQKTIKDADERAKKR